FPASLMPRGVLASILKLGGMVRPASEGAPLDVVGGVAPFAPAPPVPPAPPLPALPAVPCGCCSGGLLGEPVALQAASSDVTRAAAMYRTAPASWRLEVLVDDVFARAVSF